MSGKVDTRASANNRLSELEAEIASLKPIQDKTDRYKTLIERLSRTDHRLCIAFSEKALEFANREGLPDLRYEIISRVAYCEIQMGNPDVAISLCEKEIAQIPDFSHEVSRAMLLDRIAFALYSKTEFTTALEYIYRAIEINEKHQQQENLGSNYQLLGIILLSAGERDKALKSFKTALEIFSEIGDDNGLSSSYNNIGVFYRNAEEFETALEYFKKAMFYSKKADIESAPIYDNYGICYRGLGKFEEALEAQYRALELREKIGDKRPIASTYVFIGEIYRDMKQYDRAIEYMKKGYDLAVKINWQNSILRASQELVRVYELIGNYKKALEYYKIFHDAESTFVDAELKEKVNEMNIRFETERKEREAEIYRLKNVELTQAKERIEEQHIELEKAYQKLEQISRVDPLTGIWNRRYFTELVQDECFRSERSGKPFSIGICDIDFFKKVNDQYGHECGDQVLVEITKLIRNSIRKQDIVARWGGEEFILLFPETDEKGALVVAEKLRVKIEEYATNYRDANIGVTVCFGVSESDTDFDIDRYIRNADRAMYHAKDAGRNRSYAYSDLD